LFVGEKHGYYMHYAVERQVLLDLAKELEALAAIVREECLQETRDDCPAIKKRMFFS